MTNIETVEKMIRGHPEGIDDDEIALNTGIQPRQQIHQICSRLAAAGKIRRESIEKSGKRRKIHNFPGSSPLAGKSTEGASSGAGSPPSWHRRLQALVAATAKGEDDLLNEALKDLALKVLKAGA
jgi:hypothetical protein